ncbi:glycosyltransferase [bacterium]|nr:glycosyltransferase [bacterium]
MSPPLTLVMPVYHEQENIARVLAEVEEKIKTPHETIVVHDTDDDPTLPVVREIMPRYPTLRTLRNDMGRGVLNAIKAGFAAVPRDGIVVVVMADLSDDLAVVDRMYSLVASGSCDLVCGSRYMRGGRQIGGPRAKSFLSRLAGVTLHALAGLPTRDATNSFRMYRASLIHAIPIESRGGFELSLELTVKAHARGYRIAELPSTWRDRTAGESRFKLMAWLPSYLRWYLLAFRHAHLRTAKRQGPPSTR